MLAPGLTSFDDASIAEIRARLDVLERRFIGPHVAADAPRAAVLVPLCRIEGVSSVLFTKRTETVGTHKGQVSFPGGRMDPDDADDVACALRELREEIGLERVDVLGRYHEAMSITGVRVSTVVGFLGDLDLSTLKLQSDEVDVAFALSISSLVDPNKREVRELGPRRAPFFTAGPHPVWGLTAFILDEFLREILRFPLSPLE
jgi:nudix motif 8